jgi:hypothetical protein
MINVDCSFLRQSKRALLNLVRQAQDKKHFPKLTLQYEMTKSTNQIIVRALKQGIMNINYKLFGFTERY